MIISDDVRNALRRVLDGIEPWSAREDYLDDVDVVREWFNAQPVMPEPDWSTAPEWAKAHVFITMGFGIWISDAPELATEALSFGGWKFTGDLTKLNEESSGQRLPIGIDWRTTLRKRPETE